MFTSTPPSLNAYRAYIADPAHEGTLITTENGVIKPTPTSVFGHSVKIFLGKSNQQIASEFKEELSKTYGKTIANFVFPEKLHAKAATAYPSVLIQQILEGLIKDNLPLINERLKKIKIGVSIPEAPSQSDEQITSAKKSYSEHAQEFYQQPVASITKPLMMQVTKDAVSALNPSLKNIQLNAAIGDEAHGEIGGLSYETLKKTLLSADTLATQYVNYVTHAAETAHTISDTLNHLLEDYPNILPEIEPPINTTQATDNAKKMIAYAESISSTLKPKDAVTENDNFIGKHSVNPSVEYALTNHQSDPLNLNQCINQPPSTMRPVSRIVTFIQFLDSAAKNITRDLNEALALTAEAQQTIEVIGELKTSSLVEIPHLYAESDQNNVMSATEEAQKAATIAQKAITIITDITECITQTILPSRQSDHPLSLDTLKKELQCTIDDINSSLVAIKKLTTHTTQLKEELLATVEVHLEEAQEHYHEILNPSLLSSTLESFGFINRKEQLAKAQQTVTETQELKKNVETLLNPSNKDSTWRDV
ncbi:MAG: hypothetical protein A3F67_10705 [Verrucomicrobia bacterium RIFCSPHIGHO2_12_FULL_41_10]|nr:MAG: hypothetical protein A3F67_10705 [Verrucomicrobia bacterium RIFCSPHIGHO2_12_FULL_41_10]HLB33236.1 hypothetical protein [Chthoniobacterales bacterium]